MRTTLLFLTAAIVFAADPPKPKAKPNPPTLAAKLNAIIARSPLAARSSFGVHVVDLRSGETVFARNENHLLVPASNVKLATSATALLKFGPNHRFTTRVVREASGDVVLVGSGDPSLSFRVYPYDRKAEPLAPLHSLEEMVDQAVAAGLKEVDGDVIGDDTLYPWEPYPPTWSQDDAQSDDGAAVSALTLNDNLIAITLSPGETPGDLAVLSLNPPLEYFAVDNRVLTTSTGTTRVHMFRLPGSHQLRLTGTVRGPATVFAPVEDPALFAAEALYEALLRRGIPVRGRPVARHRAEGEELAPVKGDTLAVRTSPPLIEILRVVNKVSQNLHAELMLREVGSGTREAGIEQINAALTKMGAAPRDFHLLDGSGLSRNALLTPTALTRLLSSMYASKDRDLWVSLLPVGGEDGTLSNRLCCTSDAHNIHAKTGTLARSLALSGYADSRSRGMLAFSIIVNNFGAAAADVRAWVDKMALALVE